MSKSILLIRHAESANNALPEQARVPDPGLTTRGVEQAEFLSTALVDFAVTELHCSPFLRSLETTKPAAARLNLIPGIYADLYEQGGCYSGYEPGNKRGEPGMGRSQLAAKYSGWHIDSAIGDEGWNAGREYETWEEVRLRAGRVAERLKSLWEQMADKARVALIIHADFKRVLIEHLLSADAWPGSEQLIYNTAVSHMVFQSGSWTLREWNSVEHLPGELRTPLPRG